MSLIGVATIVPLGESYAKVRQFAIHPDMQNKGFGRQLNQYIEEVALLNKITHIVLHARESAVSFYEKNKYKKTDHPKFIEVGIPHFRMCKKLL